MLSLLPQPCPGVPPGQGAQNPAVFTSQHLLKPSRAHLPTKPSGGTFLQGPLSKKPPFPEGIRDAELRTPSPYNSILAAPAQEEALHITAYHAAVMVGAQSSPGVGCSHEVIFQLQAGTGCSLRGVAQHGTARHSTACHAMLTRAFRPTQPTMQTLLCPWAQAGQQHSSDRGHSVLQQHMGGRRGSPFAGGARQARPGRRIRMQPSISQHGS